MVVDPDGPPCPCGRRGCWERYASGSGLARLAREAAVGRRVSRVLELAGGDSEAVRGEHVMQAAREGDPTRSRVIDEFGRWVALGLVNLTNLLDPEMFVLGGGLAAGADLYLEPIQRWFGELLYQPELPAACPSVAFALLERARRRDRRGPALQLDARAVESASRLHRSSAWRGPASISRQAASRPPMPAVDESLPGSSAL